MVCILTDSTSELSAARQAELGVEVAPLTVHFGEETFRDGVDITNHAFYDRLRRAEALPVTAQVNPEEFVNRFRAHVEAGDEVVGIFLSSLLSGTFQSASIARDIVDETHIFVVDSGAVTFGLGLLVEYAVMLRDQGRSAARIAAEVQAISGRVRLLAVVDTLKYLKMGGRISGSLRGAGRDAGHHSHPQGAARGGGGRRQGAGPKGGLPVDGSADGAGNGRT